MCLPAEEGDASPQVTTPQGHQREVRIKGANGTAVDSELSGAAAAAAAVAAAAEMSCGSNVSSIATRQALDSVYAVADATCSAATSATACVPVQQYEVYKKTVDNTDTCTSQPLLSAGCGAEPVPEANLYLDVQPYVTVAAPTVSSAISAPEPQISFDVEMQPEVVTLTETTTAPTTVRRLRPAYESSAPLAAYPRVLAPQYSTPVTYNTTISDTTLAPQYSTSVPYNITSYSTLAPQYSTPVPYNITSYSTLAPQYYTPVLYSTRKY